MTCDQQYTPTERELTQILVTELLAHQFCFPVQWIQTQDAFLRDFATERLVEVGPAETLVNMAKKSLKASYESHDMALGLQRELLSYKKNADEIYYKVQANNEAIPPPSSAAAATPAPAATTTTTTITPPPTQPSVPAAPTAAPISVPDKPVTPLDLLAALVSVALKKPPSQITEDQTIKALCGGRSTVQNEIIGDLTKEFGGCLPDQPEDMSLADLGAALSDAGLGARLGPCTNALVGKAATTRMPTGTSASALRRYVEGRWGFGAGLQDRVLLGVLSRQLGARLAGEKELHLFLDEVARDVLRGVGVDPAALSSGGGGAQQHSGAASVAVSSEALDALRKERRSQDQALLDVYAKRLNHDLNGAGIENSKAKAIIDELQAKIDAWSAEHGEAYESGITPKFDAKKARRYDSYWNWVVQDVLALFSAASEGQVDVLESQVLGCLAKARTRATPQLHDVVEYLLGSVKGLPRSPRSEVMEEWLMILERECQFAVARQQPAPFRHSVVSTVPVLEISEAGKIGIREVLRVMRSSDCVAVSASCDDGDDLSSIDTQSYCDGFSAQSVSVFSRPVPTDVTPNSSAASDSLPPTQTDYASFTWTPELKTKGPNGWRRNDDITNGYLRWFQRASVDGVSFHGKAILVTGAGKDSIGSEIVSMSLAAGANVLVTTSSYSKETCDYYQSLYRQHGARQSQLVVVPFNGGSKQDIQNLVKYIYDTLGWDLDHVVPFAAVGEAGRAVDNIDDKSELAHRVMLTNLVRLLGCIKTHKVQRRMNTHLTHVLLPLSPNHGTFGQDGLYAESKIGLEALINKWWSEDWQEYLTLCGTIIGWTRGTGLMSNNDMLATGIEQDLNIRTFSASEMAWHIIGLMDASTASFCELEPLMADLSGRLSSSLNLKPVLKQIQDNINFQTETKKSVFKEQTLESNEAGAPVPSARKPAGRKARIQLEKANLPDYQELRPLAAKLQGMVDLERVVVVVGFGEAGPCGSSRTRWEAECSGTFSVDGCLELAWIMGLIKYHNGPVQGKDYCGFIDAETKAPIADAEVKAKYEDYMIQHTGIRVIEQQEHDLTTPNKEQMLHEVVITEDLEPFEVSFETAEDLKREHGDDKVIVKEKSDGQFMVTLKAGVTLMVPKAVKFRNALGAQMPQGWDARRYGISDDIISQVDPVTLYALVATVEAFLSAGITDPYELYEHIHVSELGNAVGASLGGLKSLHEMFKRRYLDRQVQSDILAETFVNTTAAWINMLFLGSSGPIRTPVGACATALESVDNGYDLIMNGRAKAVLVGGTDALERDIAQEFANMKATIDADEDAEAGRTPKESSRPTTSTRHGFVEGEGCGIQLLTTARLAIDMGLPIRAIIALTHTASDKIGRSVPAPGKGVLTIAAEKRGTMPSSLLDINYRRRQLSHRLRQIEEKRSLDQAWLNDRLLTMKLTQPQQNTPPPANWDEYVEQCRDEIVADARRAFKEARNTYGNDFWRHDDSISPLRGALAVWGLTVDDLGVASLHGTSTRKNDTNETAVVQSQLAFLGRTRGNVLPCVLQKSLLGHGKGAAGAFAVNGCVQMLATGLIPGNRNADNIDAELQQRDLLFFPSATYRSPTCLKAFSVTSFGFGQKGAQVIGVNARYLFATLSEREYDAYRRRVARRQALADRALQNGIYGGSLVRLKDKSVYEDDRVEEALLNRA